MRYFLSSVGRPTILLSIFLALLIALTALIYVTLNPIQFPQKSETLKQAQWPQSHSLSISHSLFSSSKSHYSDMVLKKSDIQAHNPKYHPIAGTPYELPFPRDTLVQGNYIVYAGIGQHALRGLAATFHAIPENQGVENVTQLLCSALTKSERQLLSNGIVVQEWECYLKSKQNQSIPLFSVHHKRAGDVVVVPMQIDAQHPDYSFPENYNNVLDFMRDALSSVTFNSTIGELFRPYNSTQCTTFAQVEFCMPQNMHIEQNKRLLRLEAPDGLHAVLLAYPLQENRAACPENYPCQEDPEHHIDLLKQAFDNQQPLSIPQQENGNYLFGKFGSGSYLIRSRIIPKDSGLLYQEYIFFFENELFVIRAHTPDLNYLWSLNLLVSRLQYREAETGTGSISN